MRSTVCRNEGTLDHRIIYYIKPDQVDVLAVVHAAMNVLRSGEESG